MWCSLLSAELNENGVPSSSSWGSGHCGSEGCWWGLPSTPPPLPPRTLKSRSLKKLVADELAVLTVKETHRNNLSASFKFDLNYPTPHNSNLRRVPNSLLKVCPLHENHAGENIIISQAYHLTVLKSVPECCLFTEPQQFQLYSTAYNF